MTVQTLTQATPSKSDLLRRSLQGDGLFEVIVGVSFIAGAKPLASWSGLDAPAILVELGIGMVLYGAWLFRIATQQPINHRAALTAASLNAAWVVGMLPILLAGWLPLTSAGWWVVALITDVVAVFAILQFYGVWRQKVKK